MDTKHENVYKITITGPDGAVIEQEVPAGSLVTLTAHRHSWRVYVEFDTDDDFALRLNGNTMYYDTLYFESVDEAIKALQNIEVINAAEWSQVGNTFTRKTDSHPAKHWFYEWINEAIASLKSGETSFVRSGNWQLQVDVY